MRGYSSAFDGLPVIFVNVRDKDPSPRQPHSDNLRIASLSEPHSAWLRIWSSQQGVTPVVAGR